MLYKDVTPSDIFKCQQCSECCKGYGGTFVTEKEIKAIVDYLHVDSESFIDNYCQVSGGNRFWHRAKMGIVYSGTDYAQFIRSNPGCAKSGLL